MHIVGTVASANFCLFSKQHKQFFTLVLLHSFYLVVYAPTQWPHTSQCAVQGDEKKKNASKCNICLDESGLKFKFSLYSTSSKQRETFNDQTVRTSV